MLIIGDENTKTKYGPFITRLLVLANVIVFIYQFRLGSEAAISEFIFQYGAIPNEVSNGIDAYTLITSMFLHGGLLHLLGNMLMLWIFGDNIEALIGHRRFLIFYLICGLVAALAQTFTNTQSNIPMVGASGAISGCMGAYLILFPKNQVKILFFIVIFRVAAFIVIGLWAAGQFMATFNTFKLKTAHTQTDNIAYAAHIGGFIAGVLYGLYYKKNVKTLKENSQLA